MHSNKQDTAGKSQATVKSHTTEVSSLRTCIAKKNQAVLPTEQKSFVCAKGTPVGSQMIIVRAALSCKERTFPTYYRVFGGLSAVERVADCVPRLLSASQLCQSAVQHVARQSSAAPGELSGRGS